MYLQSMARPECSDAQAERAADKADGRRGPEHAHLLEDAAGDADEASPHHDRRNAQESAGRLAAVCSTHRVPQDSCACMLPVCPAPGPFRRRPPQAGHVISRMPPRSLGRHPEHT